MEFVPDWAVEGENKMKKWLGLVKVLAPIILTSVRPELAPIAGEISDAIEEAEQIKGARGPEKLQHVKNIANSAADVVNSAKKKEVINKEELNKAVENAVNTVVNAVNIVNKSAEAQKPPQ